MPYSSEHLIQGENPPSSFSQLLANLLPSWTDARNLGLPHGPGSLTFFPAASGYSASAGSHWQRLINAFALELEVIDHSIDENIYERFLSFPGTTPPPLDTIYRYILPTQHTIVNSASANLVGIFTPYNNPDGTQQLDPNRTPAIKLARCNTLSDFYWGIANAVSFPVSGSSYVLPSRVGQNTDGTNQVEWVTLDGVEVTNFSVGVDQKTVTFTAPPTGSTIVVHYSTYDVYYILQEQLPTVYFRNNYFEVFLQTVTDQSALLPGVNTHGVSPGEIIVTPQIHMLWNGLDEIGLLLSKPRGIGENNWVYQRRLTDATLYPQDSTLTGLVNALATELNLVSHISWGASATTPVYNLPTIAATAASLTIGNGNVYRDSVLVNKLALPYYSIVPLASSSTITLPITGLSIGQTVQVVARMMATGGPVVPAQVPCTYTLVAPPSAMAFYDNIRIEYGAGYHSRPGTIYTAQTASWYPGSLNVWKNGTFLVRGVDFQELSTSVFKLTSPTVVGDQLQLGYIYDNTNGTILELESQPDVLTDLAPIIRVAASVAIDPVNSSIPLFPGWSGIPPGVDANAVPPHNTWSVTFQVTNSGSAPASAFSIAVTLPPTINFDGKYLSCSPFGPTMDLRYIDGDRLWVRNLTSPLIKPLIYDAEGRSTPLLKAFAQQISAVSPIVWGDVYWDRGRWGTLSEVSTGNIAFLPNLYDPQPSLTPANIPYTGLLVKDEGGQPQKGLPGQGIFGQSVFGVNTLFGAATSTPNQVVYYAPGNAVSIAGVTRYTDFQSGVGFDDDLQAQIAFPDMVDFLTIGSAVSGYQLGNLANAPITPALFIPSSATQQNAWYAAINPGVYYLNQEQHYLFSAPQYAEMFTQSMSIGYLSGNNLTASIYDPDLGLIPMRRVYFQDTDGNLSLHFEETIQGTGTNLLYASYRGLSSINFLSSSDGLTYTPTPTAAGNIITLDKNTFANITLSYVLTGSYILDFDPTILDTQQATITLDQVYQHGVLVEWESTPYPIPRLADLPVHPYFNVRRHGFLYVSNDFQVPTDIQIICHPQSIPADGVTDFAARIRVKDANGAGVFGQTVTLLANYGGSGGPITYTGTTDEFGVMTTYFVAPTTPRMSKITASLQLVTIEGKPYSTLIDHTFVNFYSPYA